MKSIKIILIVVLCLSLTSCNTGVNTETDTDADKTKDANIELTIEEVDIPEDALKETAKPDGELNSPIESSFVVEINNLLEKENFIGSLLIYEDGEKLFSKGIGLSNAERQLPNTPDTVFLASMLTMQFTAVSILMLEEQGLLSVDDPIHIHLDFPDDYGITIHHLLTHTSGLWDYQMFIDKANEGIIEEALVKTYTPQELIDLIIDMPLKSKPGDVFMYNASNYLLLGSIIEQVSGMSYETYVDQNILKPLEMNNTGFSYIDEISNHALSYDVSKSLKDGTMKYYPTENYNKSWQYAFAGLSSTVDDLYKWHRALSDFQLLSKESTSKMYIPYTDNPFDSLDLDFPVHSEGFGYGWIIEKSGETPIVYHNATARFWEGNMYRDLEKDQFIVFLCNTNNGAHLCRKYVRSHKLKDDIITLLNGRE